MKWFGITGSWRSTSAQVEHDVRIAVRAIILRGDGIVTGGALNVDWFATEEALRHNPTATQIRVYLPVALDKYALHYRVRAREGVITAVQAESLIAQLTQLKTINPTSLIEHPTNTTVDATTYYERNTAVVNASDEILAFQVNGSPGVQDTVEKARAMKKTVHLKEYVISS